MGGHTDASTNLLFLKHFKTPFDVLADVPLGQDTPLLAAADAVFVIVNVRAESTNPLMMSDFIMNSFGVVKESFPFTHSLAVIQKIKAQISL